MDLTLHPHVLFDVPLVDGLQMPADYAIREARTADCVNPELRRAADLLVRSAGLGVALDKDEWRYIADVLTVHMRSVPQVVVVHLDVGPVLSGTVDDAVAVQLWNMLIAGLPIKTCENENCFQYFTKQRGNPGKTRTRTDVRFCSVKCGTATRVRRTRARQRAAAAAEASEMA